MQRLQATQITAGYAEADVLKGVSLTCRSGELIGLLGPNGCGKSTLLRALMGILPLRSGSVTLGDKPLGAWNSEERARHLAFVPQNETTLFDFTVQDVVLMGRYPHRRGKGLTKEDFAIVQAALDEADLRHLAARPVTQLSGGEYRRVLLARSLAQQADLLLMDEPTAHLDITHQAELLHRVHRLTRERGVGAVLALHDLGQAAEYCDRLVLMRDGKILAEGIPDAVLTVENMAQVYGAAVQIGKNPLSGRPMLLSIQPLRE